MKVKSFIQFLAESPYLFPIRKELEDLSSTPMSTIKRDFSLIGKIDKFDFSVYENKDSGAILAGIVDDENFNVAVRIACEERSLYKKSMQLSSKIKHVAMVNVDKKLRQQLFTVGTYNFVSQHYDLVSDRLQYRSAKDLWVALSRSDEVNVYVFAEGIKDYLRDTKGDIIKYNGTNIDDDKIWGQKEEHQNRLLVSTIRTLK